MPQMATFETIGYSNNFLDYHNFKGNTLSRPEDMINVLPIIILFPFLLCWHEIWMRKKIYNRFGIINLFIGFLGVFLLSIGEIFKVKNLTKENLSSIPYIAVLYFILFIITWAISSVARKRMFQQRFQSLAQREHISTALDNSKTLSDIIQEAKLFLTFHLRKDKNDNTPIAIQNRLELEQIATAPYFVDALLKIVQERGLSDRDITYASLTPIGSLNEFRFKSYTHKPCRPSKIIIFNYILGLRLNLQEAKSLLKSAGYSLSSNSKLDVLMEYIIQRHLYDIVIANEILHAFHCPLLKVDRVTFQLEDKNYEK